MAEREILAAKRPRLELRARILQAIRSFFIEDGFLEVQTPIRTRAPAPEPHIDAVPSDGGWFLITSPELYMKRLLAAGYEKVFQLTPAFRQGERGRFHHPEFTILEWYRSGADYRSLQEDCQSLLLWICRAIDRLPRAYFRGEWLEIGGNWEHITVREAFIRFAGWEPGPDVEQERFDLALVEQIEPRLGFPSPCFLEDYPANQAALARIKPADPAVAERFELYWGGIELANGFSELTDPDEQRRRFEEVIEERRASERSIGPMPEYFLDSLHHLPPCAGIAMGVDRLVMMLSGAGCIDEILAFTQEMEAPGL